MSCTTPSGRLTADSILGFAAASFHKYNPVLSVIIDESLNDTLDDNMCPAAGSSDPQTNQWLSTFAPPITKALNKGAPHANLTDTDTFNLISVCAFESVYRQRRSEFCDFFASEKGALPGFAYNGDLDKYYNTGYVRPIAYVIALRTENCTDMASLLDPSKALVTSTSLLHDSRIPLSRTIPRLTTHSTLIQRRSPSIALSTLTSRMTTK